MNMPTPFVYRWLCIAACVLAGAPVLAQPANDNPCGATLLTVNASCTFTATNNTAATATTGVPAPTCASYGGADVWFRLVVPASGQVTIDSNTGTITDSGMALYTAPSCSGTFTQVDCDDDDSGNGLMSLITATSLTPGSTVYVRFWRFGGGTGTFSICAYGPASAPANDNCATATALVPGATCTPTAGSTAGATQQLPPTLCSGATSATANEVWYSFTATATTHAVNVQGAGTFDAVVAAYSGACPGTLISCVDATAGGGAETLTLNGLTAGVTYRVRVYPYGATSGTFTICVTTAASACAAVNIPTLPVTNQAVACHAANLITAANVANLCGAGNTLYLGGNEALYTVTPTTSGPHTITYNGQTYSSIWVYTASCPAAGGTCVGSVSGTGASQSLTVNMSAGVQYWVMFDTWPAPPSPCPGTFSISAPPVPPPGGCLYTLTLNDSFGDGWGTSAVGVSVNGGAFTWHTVTGSTNTVYIPVGVGNVVVIQYNASGGFQLENSYTITLNGGLLFASGSPPAAGIAWSNTVTCQPPPAPPEDCVGSITICSGQSFNNNTNNTGSVADLTLFTAGCLGALERQGTWYNFTIAESGQIGFNLNPTDPTDDYDFALWGPFPPGSTPGNICPPLNTPLRCSFAAPPGETGMNFVANDVTEDPSGDKWVRYIDVVQGQVYLMYISNFSLSGLSFSLAWNLQGGASLDCTVLPMELLSLSATTDGNKVLVDWTTTAESGTVAHDVERSSDGVHFVTIGRTTAAGNSLQAIDYRFVDASPLPGVNYYRLRTIDVDGGRSTSHQVTARMDRTTALVDVVPNPADDRITSLFNLGHAGPVEWRIRDMSGRQLASATVAGVAGANVLELPLTRLDGGSYLLELLAPGGEVLGTARFVKQ
jgi:hypothetical protein